MGVRGQPHAPAASTPGKDPVPIVQEAGWAPGRVWTDGKSRPHRDSIPDRPARSSVAILTEPPGPQKGKWSRYRPGVAQRVGRGIALLFHDRGTRRGWVVSSTPRPPLPPGETRYPLYRRLGEPQGRSGWAENLVPTGDSIPDLPARSSFGIPTELPGPPTRQYS